MNKNFFRGYIIDWHMIIIYILAVLWVAYQAAYKYLDPQNLQWQQALIQAVLAILGLLLYGHLQYTKSTDGSGTMRMGAVNPNEPRYH